MSPQPLAAADESPSWSSDRGLALVLPPSTLRIRLAAGRHGAAQLQRQLANTGAGTVVAATAGAPGSRRRLRQALTRAGVEVLHEYILLPSVDAPVVVVEDSTAALRWIWRNFVTVPPGATRTAGPMHLAILLSRRLPPRLLSALLPGRVAVGRVR